MPEDLLSVIRLLERHRVSFDNINVVLDGIGIVVRELNLGEVTKIEFGHNRIAVRTQRTGGGTIMYIHSEGICRIIMSPDDDSDTGTQFKIDEESAKQIQLYFDAEVMTK